MDVNGLDQEGRGPAALDRLGDWNEVAREVSLCMLASLTWAFILLRYPTATECVTYSGLRQSLRETGARGNDTHGAHAAEAGTSWAK